MVPPLSEKEGFRSASPTAFFHEQFATRLHYLKPPSMWKEGDRLRWRIENSLAHESTLHTRSHPCHCTANQLCATLHCPANQLGSPAITHRWRGPPSFRERGLFSLFFSFSFYIIGRFWGMKKPRVWCPRFCGCLVIRRCGLRWCMGIRCRIESLRFDPVPVRGYTCHRRCKCLRGMRCRPRIRGHPVGVLRG